MSVVTVEDVLLIIEEAGVVADMEKIKVGNTLTDAGVDSLDLANVLLGIEEKYDIKIPDEDIVDLETVDAIVTYVQAKTV